MKTLLSSPFKSPLKSAARNISRIGFTPKARRVRALDFDRRSEYVKFADWIKGSTEELTQAPLPSRKELKKLSNFEVAGAGGGGLAGLLGLGGLGMSFLGGMMPKIDIPFGTNPFGRNPKGRRPKNRGGRNRYIRDRGSRDRFRDSRNNRTNRRTQNRTTQRPGRTGPMSDAERRYRRRFGDKAGDRKFGPRQQGRVQNRGFRNPLRQRPNVTGTGADRFRQGLRSANPLSRGARVTGGRVDRALNTGPMRALRGAGRMGMGGARAAMSATKTMLKGVQRIPIVGALIAGVVTYFEDVEGGNDPNLPGGGPDGRPDMKLDKALFSAGGAALGGFLGTFIPIPVIGTLIGGLIGEYIGELSYLLIRGGGINSVGQKLKKDFEKLMEVGGHIKKWAEEGFSRLYEALPKIKIPEIPGWLKKIDFMGWLQKIPLWGKEIPKPSILELMASAVMNVPKAFFSRDPMKETDEERKKRLKQEAEQAGNIPAGQKAILGGLPVIWDGNDWVPDEEELAKMQEVSDDETGDGDFMPVSNTGGSLTNIVPVANLQAKGVYAGNSQTNDVGMTSGRGQRWGKHHAGVDIGTSGESGWHVAFALSGVVSDAGTFGTYGKLVVITCGNKDFTFAHLKRIDVRKGQKYNGQIIGEIGNTGGGNNTGNHLHFEAAPAGKGGRPGHDLDPMPYVKYLRIGRLAPGQSTPVLAQSIEEAEGQESVTTGRIDGSQLAQADPAAQKTGDVAIDPKVSRSKTQTIIVMENLAKIAQALGGGQQQPAAPTQTATNIPANAMASSSTPPGRGAMGGGSLNISENALLNNYWQTTLLTRLS